jgi:glycosyltransferase involved in cell wall biosynthesis
MTDGRETVLRQMPIPSRLAFMALAAVGIASRPLRALRRILRLKPRLAWGPLPVISIKYWSAALRARGYPSCTIVRFVSRINVRGDFDRHTDEFLGPGALSGLARPFAVFAWLLVKADVLCSFLDGGFLQDTPLREVEGRLLKLGGVKLVGFPYGSDVAVPGHIGVAEEALLRDYPEFVETAERTRQRVDWFCRWSDVVIRNWQFGYLPRWDVVWTTMLAIDTDEWISDQPDGDADGVNGEVVVVHAPNHRHVKGTEALSRAVADLHDEGLKVKLKLMEGKTNEEVKQAVLAADIVADQFLAGYAMFAVEGLSAGKPVLSALSGMPHESRTEALKFCPIVDTNVENLTESLRRLVCDPELRHELGEAGRRFALDYHSLPAVAHSWEAILDHLWRGAPLPRELPAARTLQSEPSPARKRRDPQPQQAP